MVSPKLGQCSVMQQIIKTEEAIKICYDRVNALEKTLQSGNSSGKEDDIRRELDEVRKLLATNETLLKELHGHNRKSFTVAIGICFLLFFIYTIYILVVGV